MLTSLDELAERMPSLLNIDHPCAQRQIAEARHAIEVFVIQCFRLDFFLEFVDRLILLGNGTSKLFR